MIAKVFYLTGADHLSWRPHRQSAQFRHQASPHFGGASNGANHEHFKGLFFTVQKFAPLLKAGASVVLTTSFLNVVGTPGLAVLSATKAAVRSLARSFAAELAGRRIRVNAVSPGPISTAFHGKLGLTEQQLSEAAAGIESKVPMHRFGEAGEVAKAVLFLAGADSSYMTGSELVVDGGMSQV